MDVPLESLNDFQQKLEAVEQELASIFKKPLKETLSQLSPFEQAKLRTSLAYAVQTLYLVSLKASGQELTDKKYLNRIYSYLTKIDAIEKQQNSQ